MYGNTKKYIFLEIVKSVFFRISLFYIIILFLSMKKIMTLISIVLLSILLVSCGEKTNLESNNTENMTKKEEKLIASGSKISVHYTGSLDDGTIFDSSHPRGQTLDFTAGAGQMIKGFDDAVIGMKIGEKKTITLAPSEAYGEYDESKKQVIEKSQLESFKNAGYTLEVGEELPTQYGMFKIIDADDTTITLDTNHELAGKTLTFEIEIVDIK